MTCEFELRRVSIALVSGQVRVSRACPLCGAENVTVLGRTRIYAVRRWRSGEPLDEVFADLSAEQRESLRTGTHPGCQDPWSRTHPPEGRT